MRNDVEEEKKTSLLAHSFFFAFCSLLEQKRSVIGSRRLRVRLHIISMRKWDPSGPIRLM